MKKRIILITIIISIIILLTITMYISFAVKFSDTYTNLFSAISCIISTIATISLGSIAVWQTFQYKSIENNRNYLPNLLIYCFGSNSERQAKLFFKANLTNETKKINVLINIPNGSVYGLHLENTKIYNNEILLNSIRANGKKVTFIPGEYYNFIRQQDILDAAVIIDEKYFKNSNYHFEFEFRYNNTEGRNISKTLGMRYEQDTYIFETIHKSHFTD